MELQHFRIFMQVFIPELIFNRIGVQVGEVRQQKVCQMTTVDSPGHQACREVRIRVVYYFSGRGRQWPTVCPRSRDPFYIVTIII